MYSILCNNCLFEEVADSPTKEEAVYLFMEMDQVPNIKRFATHKYYLDSLEGGNFDCEHCSGTLVLLNWDKDAEKLKVSPRALIELSRSMEDLKRAFLIEKLSKLSISDVEPEKEEPKRKVINI